MVLIYFKLEIDNLKINIFYFYLFSNTFDISSGLKALNCYAKSNEVNRNYINIK